MSFNANYLIIDLLNAHESCISILLHIQFNKLELATVYLFCGTEYAIEYSELKSTELFVLHLILAKNPN